MFVVDGIGIAPTQAAVRTFDMEFGGTKWRVRIPHHKRSVRMVPGKKEDTTRNRVTARSKRISP